MLLLVSVKGGNIPAKHIFDGRTYKVTVLCVEYYKPALPLPPHALIFNAVGDADLCHEALTIAERIVARSDAPVINPACPGVEDGAGRECGKNGRAGACPRPAHDIEAQERI